MILHGKKLIVTGGARGIGGATVVALAAAGATVALLDVLESEAIALTRRVNEITPGSTHFFKCDVSKRAHVQTAFALALDVLGGLNGVAHIAGVERSTPAEDIDDAHWDMMLDVNARGTMLVNQAAFVHLRERGGKIVNFGSAAGVTGMPGAAAYAAAKGATLAWTRTVAREWARYNITVNAVAPGIWTPMYDNYRSRLSEIDLAAHDALMAKTIPLGGRLGDAERDMAPVMVFLMSDAAGFITGQTLPVDGGMLTLT